MGAIVGGVFGRAGQFLNGARNDAGYRVAAVQRGVWVLEDNLHSTHFGGAAFFQRGAKCAAVECDRAACVVGNNAKQHTSKSCFARTGFADQAKCFAGLKVQRNIHKHLHVGLVLNECLRNVVHIEKR